jgi:hypothetical protein
MLKGQAVTDGVGADPLFAGVMRVEIAGMSELKVVREGDGVRVVGEGVDATFSDADARIETTSIQVRLK